MLPSSILSRASAYCTQMTQKTKTKKESCNSWTKKETQNHQTNVCQGSKRGEEDNHRSISFKKLEILKLHGHYQHSLRVRCFIIRSDTNPPLSITKNRKQVKDWRNTVFILAFIAQAKDFSTSDVLGAWLLGLATTRNIIHISVLDLQSLGKPFPTWVSISRKIGQTHTSQVTVNIQNDSALSKLS